MKTSTILSPLPLILHTVLASAVPNTDASNRSYGVCKQLDIPVFATANSAVYKIPTVDSNLEAKAWAIYTDTWSNPAGPTNVLKNTTTSQTFNIHAQLCIPSSGQKKDILQIATHGVAYDSRYWDPALNRESQSYVEATLKAGYSILTYDRLGVGQSDLPDAYTVVQAPVELEILRQLTLMARNGTLYSFAAKAKPDNANFNSLTKPQKVVHVGHSFGSFLTSALIARYSNLTDGAIITGFAVNKYLGKPGMASFVADFAPTSKPSFKRSSGYIVSQKSGIQNIFFGGDLKTAYTQAMLDYGNDIKQPIPIGEFASAYQIIGLPGPDLVAPVQYMLAEFDFYVCGGDCKGVTSPEILKGTYPNATIEVAIQPNTGHGLTLHNNATAGYQVTYDFLARHGL